MHLYIATGTDIWKVDDLLSKPTNTHSANGVKFSIEDAHFENGALHMKLTVSSADPVPNLIGNLDRLSDSLKIYDGEGHRLQQDTDNGKDMILSGTLQTQTNTEGNREFSKELTFKGDKAPVEGPISIEWSLPGNIRPLVVPFELHDVMP